MSTSSPSKGSDFARAMGPVARELLGDPTEEHRGKGEIRYGTRGSLSIDLTKGTWRDHEAGNGGGVLDLVRVHTGLDKEGAVRWLRDRGHLPNDHSPSKPRKRQVAAYDYTNENGDLLFQVVRFEPKDFRQRRPDGAGGWEWKTAGMDLVLFRLPEVVAGVREGHTIYIVEGEKGANALAALGVVATCSPGGAGKWKPSYGEPLRGANVIVLPDNDPQSRLPDGSLKWHPDGRPVLPGQDHAADIARHLKGVAASVRVLMLPDLPLKGDVADWIAAGGTLAELESLQTAEPTAELEPAQAEQVDYESGIMAVVERFNSRFMLVNESGKAVIFQPGYDPVLKRRRFDRLTHRDLGLLYMNETIAVGMDEKGRTIRKPVSDVWLRHPKRRQYVQGVTFDPTTTAPIPGVLNLWEGFAVAPAPGDWSLLRAHIEDVICDGDDVRFMYLFGWMARMFQNPAEQGEVAVVMKGGEGTGKGTLAKVLMRLVGHHGLAIANGKHLVGNFNAHLRDVIFLFADEALFAGDRAHVGALKSLITEPYLTIEAKHQNAIQAPNFLHVMMASNEAWVVPASQDARRFFVLEVSEKVKGDHNYFARIWAQMEAGGFAAMLHDLLAMDLTTFNVRAVPTTEGLQRQKKLSLPTTEAWWLDCLQRGYVYRSKLGLEEMFSLWHPTISTELLFASYIEFAKSRNERRILSREDLGRFFVSIGATAKRWRNGVVGEHLAEVETFNGYARRPKPVRAPRVTGYHLDTLDEARAAFSAASGLDSVWDDGDPMEDGGL